VKRGATIADLASEFLARMSGSAGAGSSVVVVPTPTDPAGIRRCARDLKTWPARSKIFRAAMHKMRIFWFHEKSGLRRIFFIFFLLKPGCIWFEVSCSVYQFIGGANDSNSNTVWSQRHNLCQTVIEKASNDKPFVKSNFLRYKSHNTISIPKQFITNNVQQGECLTQRLQIWIWPNSQITLFERTRESAWLDAVTAPLIRSEWILVY